VTAPSAGPGQSFTVEGLTAAINAYNEASQNVDTAGKALQARFTEEMAVCKGESFTVARVISDELNNELRSLAATIRALSENINGSLKDYLATHEEERAGLQGILGSTPGAGAGSAAAGGRTFGLLTGQQ
jgi:hypothetical protein